MEFRTILAGESSCAQLNALESMYPAYAQMLGPTTSSGVSSLQVPVGASVYGYVITGLIDFGSISARRGSAFAVPAEMWNKSSLHGASFWAVVRYGFNVPAAVAVPEYKGRLSYIDGCSDSLLFYPPRKGDGSMSLLYFPPGIDQSWHTHPSIRLGYVLSGEGMASHDGGETPLVEGTMFLLPEQGRHRFRTESEEMRILAYHPDGDWGPTDEVHPMKNRTYLSDK